MPEAIAVNNYNWIYEGVCLAVVEKLFRSTVDYRASVLTELGLEADRLGDYHLAWTVYWMRDNMKYPLLTHQRGREWFSWTTIVNPCGEIGPPQWSSVLPDSLNWQLNADWMMLTLLVGQLPFYPQCPYYPLLVYVGEPRIPNPLTTHSHSLTVAILWLKAQLTLYWQACVPQGVVFCE